MNSTDSHTPHGAHRSSAPDVGNDNTPFEPPVPTGAPEPACRPKVMPNWAWALVVVVVAILYYFYVARSRH